MDEPPEQTLEELREIIRRQSEELEDANEVLTTIAHNMKSRLSIIAGYTGLLLQTDETLTDESQMMLEGIERAVFQAMKIISDALLLRRAQHGEEQIEVVQIKPVIQAALQRFQQRLAERGFSVAVQDGFPAVMGQGAWIEHVFANLIDNAIRYMSADQTDPRITIRSVPQGEMIRFEVEDNGPGIQPEIQERLNSMFSQSRNERPGFSRARSGPGLGLALVARIAERLGGEFGVESNSDDGTRIWFTLPAASEVDS